VTVISKNVSPTAEGDIASGEPGKPWQGWYPGTCAQWQDSNSERLSERNHSDDEIGQLSTNTKFASKAENIGGLSGGAQEFGTGTTRVP